MDATEVEKLIGELEIGVDRLRSLYEQYFMGFEKLEPTVPRKDVDRKIHVLRKEQIRNTALRFRFQMILQRYNTYQTHWQRICREIDNGTYKRHLSKAQRRFGSEAPRSARRSTPSSEPAAAPTSGSDVGAPSSIPPSPMDRPQPGARLPADLAAELAELDKEFAPAAVHPQQAAPKLAPPPPPATARLDSRDPARPGTKAVPVPPKDLPVPAARTVPGQAAKPPVPKTNLAGPAGQQAVPPASPGPAQPGAAAASSPTAGPAAQRPLVAGVAAGPVPPRPAVAGAPAGSAPRPAVAGAPTGPLSPRVAAAGAAAGPMPMAPRAAPAGVPDAPLARATGATGQMGPTSPSAAGRPAQAPPVPARAPTTPSREVADDLPDDRLRQLYSQYVETRRRHNESNADVPFDAVAKNLRESGARLREKHGKAVDFEVMVKDGKTFLRPIIK